MSSSDATVHADRPWTREQDGRGTRASGRDGHGLHIGVVNKEADVLLVRIFIGTVVGGAVVVAAFLVAGLADGQEDRVAEPETVAEVPRPATTATTEAPWVAEGEARFESTVLVSSTLSVGDRVARLEYELATLGPTLVGDEFGDSMLVPVQPEYWLLVTGAGNRSHALIKAAVSWC